MDKETAYKRLYDRVMLLSRGIVVSPRKWWIPTRDKQSFYGGAGPIGRIYNISYDGNENNASEMISLPIYPKNHYLAKYAISTKRDKKNKHNLILNNGTKLIGIAPPKSRSMKFSDGKPINRSGLVNIHCYNTFSTVFSWNCNYFDNNNPCKYCTIDLTKKWLDAGSLTDRYIIEALKLTNDNTRLRSVTLTGGTIETPDKTVRYLIDLCKKIRESVDISIHVQFEPVCDCSLFKELSKYAESVGIFLEIFDEDIRKRICPGKSKIPKQKYFDNWNEAIKIFGKGNVGTSCLLGFGENYSKIIKDIGKCIELGVIVMPLLIRPGSKNLGEEFIPSYVKKEDQLLDFHIKIAEELLRNNLAIKVGQGSGCLGCMGCSAMMEAYEYTKIYKND